ncbi:metabolite traffic protein EboE [bacterium]|nr:metabolite traffic protein EboE [bacterium]
MRLGYCLNVHPGETLEEVLSALRGPVARARRIVGAPIGVGLYLAARAAREVGSSEEKVELLRGALAEAGAVVFTANAFPFGGFHEDRVKREVYKPTWFEPERLAYTCDVAHALASLLKEGESGSISTLPVSFRAFPHPDLGLAGAALGEAGAFLEILARKRGRELALAIEPEPRATLERASELVVFLEDHVFSGEGRAAIERALSLPRAEAEAVARRRVGACLDTCHHAVVFEEIEEALSRYEKAGVRVVKAQLSSALEVVAPGQNSPGVERLRSFIEPRYLHQTYWKEPSVASVEDLPEIFLGGALRPAIARSGEVRSHFHVPLAWEGEGGLGTTRPLLERALGAISRATDHLEVETYTFSVLPEETKRRFQGDVAAMVARELLWVRERSGENLSRDSREPEPPT